MTVLTTARLDLRFLTANDAPAYWPLVSHPAILRYTGEAPIGSIAGVRELLVAKPLKDYASHGYGRLACIERATGDLVGFCGLKYLDDLGETDIGYRFLPRCWGLGYATESATAVMRHGRDVLRLKRIIGLVAPANTGSVRVLQKLGMEFESRVKLADHADELLLYASNAPDSPRRSGAEMAEGSAGHAMASSQGRVR